MIRPRIILVAAVFTTALSFTYQATANAATKSITLSPSSTNLILESGLPANRDLTLINDGDTLYTVSLSVAPYHVQDENYDPVFTRLPGTTDASQWVTLSQKSLTLAPHQTATIPYVLTPPKSTAAGGYYAVIFAETSGIAAGGVSASNRVGDILYMTVDGHITQSGSIEGVNVPKFIFGSTLTIAERVTNSGGVHFQSDTHMAVTSVTGKSVFSADSTHYVLPQTTRLISSSWPVTSFAGIYKVSRSATVAGSNKTVPDAWVVIATPKIIPLIVFVVLALVGFIILLSRTRHNKRS